MTRQEAIAKVEERTQWYVKNADMDYKNALLRVLAEDEKLRNAYLGLGPGGTGVAEEVGELKPPWTVRRDTGKAFVERILMQQAEEKSKVIGIPVMDAFRMVLADPDNSYLAKAYMQGV